jgi:hypothetical protein
MRQLRWTIYNDIVVTKTIIGVAVAGMLPALLLFGSVLVCAARGFACLVLG